MDSENGLNIQNSTENDSENFTHIKRSEKFRYILKYLLSVIISIIISIIISLGGFILFDVNSSEYSGLAAIAIGGYFLLFFLPSYAITFYIVSSLIIPDKKVIYGDKVHKKRYLVIIRLLLMILPLFIVWLIAGAYQTIDIKQRGTYDSDRLLIESIVRGNDIGCSNLSNFSKFKIVCQAVVKGDLEYCDKIDVEARWPSRSRCIDYVLEKTSNLVSCQQYCSSDESCQLKHCQPMAIKQSNSEYCKNFLQGNSQKFCLNAIAYLSRNNSLCQNEVCNQLFNNGYEFCQSNYPDWWDCASAALYISQDVDGCATTGNKFTKADCQKRLNDFKRDFNEIYSFIVYSSFLNKLK